jgi:hypothetical protein
MPQGWESFYLLLGGAAGALIGLLFVVITLTADLNPAETSVGSKVYVSPTVFHFATVFVISAAALVPEGRRVFIGLAVAILALIGFGYSLLGLIRLARGRPKPTHWSDWIYYGLFPAAAYAGLAVAGSAFLSGHTFAPEMTAGGAVVLLVGIRDAWDVALWVSQHPPKERAGE